jgi:hypothetical protein
VKEDIIMTLKIAEMSETVKTFFTHDAEQTARETGFVQRTSKMTGSLWLQMWVLGLLDTPQSALNHLAEFCEDQFSLHITAQGIDDRVHSAAVHFFKAMFGLAVAAFRQTVRIPIRMLTQFTAVNIFDSTGISLPVCLAEAFPGSGGDASPAAMKLQLVFEFLTGAFKAIDVTDGRHPDQAYARFPDAVERGSLNLFDLGYFTLTRLKGIMDKGAYFVCRLLHGTGLYDENGEKIDLLHLLRGEERNAFECWMQVGADTRLRLRVCCFRVPEEIANRRRQKARTAAAKKGRHPTKESLELMGWTILLTNTTTVMIPLTLIALLYALRWQIELIFKLWKSQAKLHQVSGFRQERVLVELYAKLIGLVLFQFLVMPLRAKNIDLSPAKAFQRFARKSRALATALRSGRHIQHWLTHLHDKLLKWATREKRKKRLSTVNMLDLEVAYYA